MNPDVTKISLSLREKVRMRLRDFEFRSSALATNGQLARLVAADPFLISARGSDGREIIFIHVPKTAGTSIETMLGIETRHVPLSRYYTWNAERADLAWKFAVVRDPAERLHSAYNYLYSQIGESEHIDVRWATEKLSGIETFETFLDRMFNRNFRAHIMRWTHFRPQMDWLCHKPGEGIALDRVFRFEKLDEGIEELRQRLDPTLKLPHLRKPRSKRVSKPLSDHHQELIHRLYRKDYEAFGYSF